MDDKAIAAPAAFNFSVLGGRRLDSAVHTRAIDAGVQPAHAFVMILRASFSDIANTLDRLLRPSKQLTLHVFDANGRLPPPLPPDHVFHNLTVLEVRWETYPNLLVDLLQRMPALTHLTLDVKDSWHDDPPQDPPPFALQTFTCRGRVWLNTQGWTWPISNPGTQRRLQSFSFRCDGAGTFTASFQHDPFASLLTEARMYLSGGVDQSISTRDADTLQRCTSLRSLELMVNWESRDRLCNYGLHDAWLPLVRKLLHCMCSPGIVG